jgi:hypothetical protein
MLYRYALVIARSALVAGVTKSLVKQAMTGIAYGIWLARRGRQPQNQIFFKATSSVSAAAIAAIFFEHLCWLCDRLRSRKCPSEVGKGEPSLVPGKPYSQVLSIAASTGDHNLASRQPMRFARLQRVHFQGAIHRHQGYGSLPCFRSIIVQSLNVARGHKQR